MRFDFWYKKKIDDQTKTLAVQSTTKSINQQEVSNPQPTGFTDSTKQDLKCNILVIKIIFKNLKEKLI